MAEIVGIVASVLQLIDTALKVREYINDFHHAPAEQQKMFSEMECLKLLLGDLHTRIVTDPSSYVLQQIIGPLSTLQTTMKQFTRKLRPEDGLSSRVATRLTWMLWTKKEAKEYLDEFERIKGLLNLSLTMDIWDIGRQQIEDHDEQRHDHILLLNSVRDVANEQQKHNEDVKRQMIIEWMSPINFFQRQADIFSNLQPGTGQWLLANPRFKNWESRPGQILWCRGIPGAGKTVLASLVVNHLTIHLRNTTGVACACVYLNHKETESQTPTNILASIWKQLVVGNPLPPSVHELYKHHRERDTRPSSDEVFKILRSAVAEHSKIFFVVDALDEYPEDERNILLEYLGMLRPAVNLMITSRPHVSLGCFPSLETIEIRATEGDIRQYLDMHILKSKRLSKHVETRPELREEIQSNIISNVDGMFLLAKLRTESLATKNTIKAVREALQHIPKDLKHTYDDAMERIGRQNEDDKQLAHSALTWVANTKRPLSVAELREALAIEPDTTTLNVDSLVDINIVLSVCAGLIIVDQTMSVVRLIHYTAQQYFDTIQAIQFPDAHTEITSKCLTYLSFTDFLSLPDLHSWKSPSTDENWNKAKRLVVDHPFLAYAQYCLLHAVGPAELHLQEKIKSFLLQASAWEQFFWNFFRHKAVRPWTHFWPESPSLLWISATCNLLGIARDLLLTEGIPVCDGGTSGSALIQASIYGHHDLVRLLLEFGADINALGHYGTPLQGASEAGHASVVELLIERGANVNAPGRYFGTALQAASHEGHQVIVELLIQKGADVNAVGGYYGTVLQASNKLMVEQLIERSVDVNAQRGCHGTALQASSHWGYEPVVELLIQKGGDVCALGGYYGTAFQAASRKRHKPVVELLLQRGANMNALGGHYGTALQAASCDGHEAVVQLLMEMGADVNAVGGYFGTALQVASYRGHQSVAELLICGGADVNALGGYYGTPLQAASSEGYKAVVELLIERGADVNLQAGYYGTALQAATCGGHEAVVELLIQMGADINIKVPETP
ncbi:ankyrin repeat-containing domain protein [Mycena epipterygia]|nr:ankyrin repeat-containing domain protein [Mycena epipterygia]